MARLLTSIVIALFAASACGVDDGASIVSRLNGITDGVVYNGHPSVGRMSAVSSEGVNYLCTGTVIGKRTVLTAAHCIKDKVSATFHVGGSRYTVSQMIGHPSYTAKPTRNDIGILILSRAVTGVTPTPISMARRLESSARVPSISSSA
jgi:secreted trypsin-like serine protease